MRLQVNVSEEMLIEIDKYAKKMGISRSAFCSYLIGSGVMNLNKAYDILDKLPSQFLDSNFTKEVVQDENK